MGDVEVGEVRRLVTGGASSLGELRLVVRDAGIRLMGPGDPAQPAPSEPEAFRRFIRFDRHGRYRALSGARGVREGWYVDCASPSHVAELIEVVYPLALRHLAQERCDALRVLDADTVLGRQTSRYAEAGALAGDDRKRAVGALCGLCVRRPRWAGVGDAGIPCPEPCGVFVALAQAIAEWDPSDPPSQPDPGVGFADFEQPGNEVRCRFLASASG